MQLSDEQVDFILNAESKAFATYGLDVNVVPVSTVFVFDNRIILVDYFMNKTTENLDTYPWASLVCWSGLEGFQVKGHVKYVTSGVLFDNIKNKIAMDLPDRVVKGVILIEPATLYDVSVKG